MTVSKEIIETIIHTAGKKDITVIGIDGPGGAGKSTVSETICSTLESSGIHTILLHIDDLIHTRAVRYNSAYPEWKCYYDLQWRYDYFRELIGKAKSGSSGSIEAELYDKDNDSYFKQGYDVKPGTAIVVEGIFLQRKELDGIFDLMIYIDVPEDERIRRVLLRDTYIGNEQQILDKYKNRYLPAEHHYFNEYHPDSRADFVIRNTTV